MLRASIPSFLAPARKNRSTSRDKNDGAVHRSTSRDKNDGAVNRSTSRDKSDGAVNRSTSRDKNDGAVHRSTSKDKRDPPKGTTEGARRTSLVDYSRNFRRSGKNHRVSLVAYSHVPTGRASKYGPVLGMTKEESVNVGDVAEHPLRQEENFAATHSMAMRHHNSNHHWHGCMMHESFVVDNAGFIGEFYEMDQTTDLLGQGAYGAVSRAKSKLSGMTVAVKSILKSQVGHVEDLAGLKRETELMRMMDHPNIVKLFECFEDLKRIYIVMELCLGGELFERISRAGRFVETHVATLMRQIFQVIHYMHHLKVVHRDLKPENFLFTTNEPISQSTLKIIDFGLSRKIKSDDEVLTTKVGTPYYVAPQVLMGRYDRSCDLWSCGVIMYVLLCGYPPFYGEDNAEVMEKVKIGHYTFDTKDWKGVSVDAKDLIRSCLKFRAKERATSEQALYGVWLLAKTPKKAVDRLSQGLPIDLLECLRKFKSANGLKKAVLHLIAHRIDERKVKQLRDLFKALDTDQDGVLTAQELKKGLKSGLEAIPDDFEELFDELDTNAQGIINYTEFIAATLSEQMYADDDICWQAFKFFDKDDNGKISSEEISRQLVDADINFMDAQEIAALMQSFDDDNDGELDFHEFMHMMESSAALPDVPTRSRSNSASRSGSRSNSANRSNGRGNDELQLPDTTGSMSCGMYGFAMRDALRRKTATMWCLDEPDDVDAGAMGPQATLTRADSLFSDAAEHSLPMIIEESPSIESPKHEVAARAVPHEAQPRGRPHAVETVLSGPLTGAVPHVAQPRGRPHAVETVLSGPLTGYIQESPVKSTKHEVHRESVSHIAEPIKPQITLARAVTRVDSFLFS